MKSEVICVGTEILLGEIIDTNSVFISRKLNELGIDLYHISTVGDNIKRILSQIELSFNRSDLVIITGGLGPTEDDVTRNAVAEFLGVKLLLNEDSKQRLINYFSRKKRKMPDSNFRQAYFPENSKLLVNEVGTADGFYIEKNDKIIVCLPGVPSEMEHMIEKYLIKYLIKKTDEVFESRYMNIYGLTESQMEEKIIDLVKNQKNPTIGTYAKEDKLEIRLTAKAENKNAANKIIAPIANEIKNRFGEHFFGYGENLKLEDVVCKILVDNNLKISTAESCTGGLLAGTLINYPGISRVYSEGFITYSNESKIKNLGVDEKLIKKYGVVSKEVALDMARKVREKTYSDVALSTTGIAGPDGGTINKKVGLIYIGYSSKKGDDFLELNLFNNRQKNRHLTVLNAINFLRLKLIRDYLNVSKL